MQNVQSNSNTAIPTSLLSPAVHVFDRSANSHKETTSPRSSAYETHTVASQKQLESTRITRKGHSITQVPAPTSTMVTGGKQCAPRSTITPQNMLCKYLQMHQRRAWLSFRQAYCKRDLVTSRKLHIN